MAANRISLALLLVLGSAVGYCAAQDYDFMYLVLQWPGSYCDTKQSCCYPKSGKPAADFGIHGLWPNRDDGSYPQNCNPDAEFDPSKVRFLPSISSRSAPAACLLPCSCLLTLSVAVSPVPLSAVSQGVQLFRTGNLKFWFTFLDSLNISMCLKKNLFFMNLFLNQSADIYLV
jgi:hypothetical protein